MPDGRATLLAAFAKAVRPRKRMTVSQWADRHRILTGKSAAVKGQWRTWRMPHLAEPMDALSAHSPVNKVVCMFPIQLGKTEVGLNWLGYIIDHDPAPTLSVQPTLELRDRYVLQRVNPLLESTACIAQSFKVKARRDGSNARDLKDFPGGLLVLGGANSAASLSSMPMKNVVADEVDKFPHDLGGEGDPLGLIEGRQSNFSRSKILVISSPTMKDSSLIESEYMGGDRRHYHLPCPHCGEWLVLCWKQLTWNKDEHGNVKEVWYTCEHNGCVIEESEKPAMLAAGKWVAENRHAPYRSYTINALYSPIGIGRSWPQLVQQWLKAQGDPIKLKRFVNTRLAETYEDLRSNMKWTMLAERAEDYPLKSVPPGALVLTAGIDTQNDRLAVIVIGHGRDGRMWAIDYVELPGDPNEQVEKFKQKKGALFDYLSQPFVNAWGKTLHIRAAAWDTGGHRTDAVYDAVRSRVVSRMLAIKGASISGKPILSARPSAQDVNRRGKTIKKGVVLWTVGTDTAKDLIFAHLAADADKNTEERKVHFSKGFDEEFYKMLLSERFDPEKNQWVKRSGVRNEVLDCWVYAIAASRHPELRLHVMGVRSWDDLERVLQPGAIDDQIEAKAVPNEDAKPAQAKPAGKPRKSGGTPLGFGSEEWRKRR